MKSSERVRKYAGKVVRKPLKLAYSTPFRRSLRTFLNSDRSAGVRRYAEAKGIDDSLRRLSSEILPAGSYFAKLTLEDVDTGKVSRVRLMQGTHTVLSSRLPSLGGTHRFQYRNIVVKSPHAADFTIEPAGLRFDLKISSGAFTTLQQTAYDRNHRVQQREDVHYSVKGNTHDPDTMIISFPDSADPSSPLSYPIDDIGSAHPARLRTSLVLAFQDRFGVCGTGLLADSAGRSIQDKVAAVVEDIRKHYAIAPERMLFYGSGLGGTAALVYARTQPGAKTVLVAPFTDLSYAIKSGEVGTVTPALESVARSLSVGSALREHVQAAHPIDYIFTESFARNQSIVELLGTAPGLRRFRLSRDSRPLPQAARPLLSAILNEFAGLKEDSRIRVRGVRAYPSEAGLGLQFRHAVPQENETASSNWFAAVSHGASGYFQELQSHPYPFVKYTGEDGRLPHLEVRAGDALRLVQTSESGQWRESDAFSAEADWLTERCQCAVIARPGSGPSGQLPATPDASSEQVAIFRENCAHVFSHSAKPGRGRSGLAVVLSDIPSEDSVPDHQVPFSSEPMSEQYSRIHFVQSNCSEAPFAQLLDRIQTMSGEAHVDVLDRRTRSSAESIAEILRSAAGARRVLLAGRDLLTDADIAALHGQIDSGAVLFTNSASASEGHYL